MFRCISGHSTNNLIACENCGQEIDLQDGLKRLSMIPEYKVNWDEVSILTVGLRYPPRDGVCVLCAEGGEENTTSETEFTVKTVLGETWHDIVRHERSRFNSWLSNTGFFKAKYKLILLDTTDPLAILTIQALRDIRQVGVFAIVGDESSNSLEANTSYVAMSLLQKKRLPTIVCSKTYVEDISIFAEDMGLVIGERAFNHVISLLTSFINYFMDVITRDSKLGVQTHYLSAIFSASDLVYPKPDSAIHLQHEEVNILTNPDDIKSAYLFSLAESRRHESIASAFQIEFRESQLFDRASKAINKTTEMGLYDMVLLVGAKGFDFQPLSAGYNQIIEMNGSLKVPENDD
jgi:hypothetical protein